MDIAAVVTPTALNPVVGDMALDELTGQPYLVDTRKGRSIAQHIRIRLNHHLGEWALNPDEGIPYREIILAKGTPQSLRESILRQVVATTPGVIRVETFQVEVDFINRSMRISAKILVSEDGIPYTLYENFIIKL